MVVPAARSSQGRVVVSYGTRFVSRREPNILRGSSCSEHGGFRVLRHGLTTLPAYRADLNYRVTPMEQGKSRSLPFGEVKPQGRSMAMRIAELRKSECCPVIGQIEVALPFFWGGTTSPHRKRSRLLGGCSNSRTFEEPMDEAKQMTTAHCDLKSCWRDCLARRNRSDRVSHRT